MWKPNPSHICRKAFTLKILFRILLGSSEGGRSKLNLQNVCARVCYYNMQCAWQKSSKNWDICSRMRLLQGDSKSHPCKMPITHRICALWWQGTLSMDSLNLGETWLLSHKKGRNVIERNTFTLKLEQLVIACTRPKRCDKSTAQRFWTAIVGVVGQQKRSKGTSWISIGWCGNQIRPVFFLLKSLRYKYCFEICWVHLDRDTVGSTKCLCMCYYKLQCAWQNNHPAKCYYKMTVSQEQKMVWGSACHKLLWPSMAGKSRL